MTNEQYIYVMKQRPKLVRVDDWRACVHQVFIKCVDKKVESNKYYITAAKNMLINNHRLVDNRVLRSALEFDPEKHSGSYNIAEKTDHYISINKALARMRQPKQKEAVVMYMKSEHSNLVKISKENNVNYETYRTNLKLGLETLKKYL